MLLAIISASQPATQVLGSDCFSAMRSRNIQIPFWRDSVCWHLQTPARGLAWLFTINQSYLRALPPPQPSPSPAPGPLWPWLPAHTPLQLFSPFVSFFLIWEEFSTSEAIKTSNLTYPDKTLMANAAGLLEKHEDKHKIINIKMVLFISVWLSFQINTSNAQHSKHLQTTRSRNTPVFLWGKYWSLFSLEYSHIGQKSLHDWI